MAVVGIGTDILNSERISKMSLTVRDKLAKRVLTPKELVTYQEKKDASQFLAKRWAAKEAASKALGTGIASGVSFQHIEINNNPMGAPIITLSDIALEKAQALGASQWHISIADDQNMVTAFVILSC